MSAAAAPGLGGQDPSPAARSPGIDRLRGVSILLVVLLHLGMRIPLHQSELAFLPRRLTDALTTNGYDAVFVFFVISGFLIAGNSLRRWGRLRDLQPRAFYARRFARIAPLLLALIAVLCLLHWLDAFGFRIQGGDRTLGRAVLAALGLHVHWYEAHHGWLPGGWDVLWSLSIEELFYLGFPLLCLALRREWLLWALLLPLSLSLPWTRVGLTEVAREKATLPGMAAIATGVWGALLAARWSPSRGVRALLVAAGAAGLSAEMAFGDHLWKVTGQGTLLVATLSTLLLLLGVERAGTTQRGGWPLAGERSASWWRAPDRLLQLCGRLSYELYLTHMFAVLAVVRLSKTGLWPGPASALWYLPGLSLVILLGIATERWLSAPCERWLRARLPRPG